MSTHHNCRFVALTIANRPSTDIQYSPTSAITSNYLRIQRFLLFVLRPITLFEKWPKNPIPQAVRPLQSRHILEPCKKVTSLRIECFLEDQYCCLFCQFVRFSVEIHLQRTFRSSTRRVNDQARQNYWQRQLHRPPRLRLSFKLATCNLSELIIARSIYVGRVKSPCCVQKGLHVAISKLPPSEQMISAQPTTSLTCS